MRTRGRNLSKTDTRAAEYGEGRGEDDILLGREAPSRCAVENAEGGFPESDHGGEVDRPVVAA